MRQFSLVLLLLVASQPAEAWSMRGHHRLAEEAVRTLPLEMPEFFRLGAEAVGHSAVDPDMMKARETPHLRHQEYPEHFLDLEYLEDPDYPELRYEYINRLIAEGRDPATVGFVPYAVIEGTERLAVAFAEYRCWPENSHVKNKALVFAGVMSHYAADMQQPLHTTVDYDGRLNAEGLSPHTGVHALVDGLFGNEGFAVPKAGPTSEAFTDLSAAVRRHFLASHALVDRVYALEPALRNLEEQGSWSPELSEFAIDRWNASHDFLRTLYVTAWRLSTDVEFGDWVRRKGADGTFSSCKP